MSLNRQILPPILKDQVVKSEKSVYNMIRLVGQGSFGELWLAKMKGTDRKGKSVLRNVAVKFEDAKAPNPTIAIEVNAYIALGLHKHVPIIYDVFSGLGRSCMAMELLGKSVLDRRDWCRKQGTRMPLKDVIQIGIQMLAGLEHVHHCKLIHRDIKPENFLFGQQGSKTQDVLRIIDFGLAKRYISEETKKHIQFNADSIAMGTPRYMSIRAHMRIQQSRRDDLEALSYVLIYLLRERMPWDGIHLSEGIQKNEEIMQVKQRTPVHELTGTDIPDAFHHLLTYSKKLGFKEDPDYEKMRGILTVCAKHADVQLDGKFSWSHADADSEISIKPQINSNAKLGHRSKQ